MDETGETAVQWAIKTLDDVTATPGSFKWMEQMKALDNYQVWLKATKAPKIHGHIDLARAMREEHGRKVKAGKQFPRNPNNPVNKSTPLSTAGRYGEYSVSNSLDDWPR